MAKTKPLEGEFYLLQNKNCFNIHSSDYGKQKQLYYQ